MFERVSQGAGQFMSGDMRVDDTDVDVTDAGIVYNYDTSAVLTDPKIAVRQLDHTGVDEVFAVWTKAYDLTIGSTLVRRADVQYSYGKDEDGNGEIAGVNAAIPEFSVPSVRVNERPLVPPADETTMTTLSTYIADQPDVAVDKTGNIYIVYRSTKEDGKYHIYFTRKMLTDEDFGWFPSFWTIADDGGTAEQGRPAIAVDNIRGRIYATWQDNRHGSWDVFFAYSDDGGWTWSRNRQVNQVDYAASGQQGESGDVEEDVDPSSADIGTIEQGVQGHPQIATDAAGNVYLLWEGSQQGDYDIYFDKLLVNDDGTVPSYVFGLKARLTGKSVELAWNHNPEFDIVGYDIYRAEQSFEMATEGTGGEGAETAGDDVTTDSFTELYPEKLASDIHVNYYNDEDVSEGVKYSYWVVARDLAGNNSGIGSEEITQDAGEGESATDTGSGNFALRSGVSIGIPVGGLIESSGSGGGCFVETAR
jgi:hypothetical protein